MSTSDAFVAVNRFGMGARRGELAEASEAPLEWVLRQLDLPFEVPSSLVAFPSSAQTIVDFQSARKQSRMAGDKAMLKAARKAHRKSYMMEAAARIQVQIETDQPVLERLVAFWSNHFTVSIRKPPVVGLAGAFEREAIRPHILGRFSDMLHAVVKHPAMLVYLDNIQSIGPNSAAGRRRSKGLNENLSREILELHTLGVDGGYTQEDVHAFAKVLTGWSVDRREGTGRFTFYQRAHEPGAKKLLDRRYVEAGLAEGEAVLDDLARHPATARHIAGKLARHFVANVPPSALVKKLAAVFRDTDGDLKAVLSALLSAPEAWADPMAKVKSPNEFVVSAMRAIGNRQDPKRLLAVLRLLGQAPYSAPSPAGWPDTAAKWASPHALLQRAELALRVGRQVKGRVPALDLVRETMGPVARKETRNVIAAAPSDAEAVAIVFAAPEFQRR